MATTQAGRGSEQLDPDRPPMAPEFVYGPRAGSEPLTAGEPAELSVASCSKPRIGHQLRPAVAVAHVIAAETGGSMRYSSAVDRLELAATDELGDRPAVARQQHHEVGVEAVRARVCA